MLRLSDLKPGEKFRFKDQLEILTLLGLNSHIISHPHGLCKYVYTDGIKIYSDEVNTLVELVQSF